MTESTQRPKGGGHARAAEEERKARQAAGLRANLRRRKMQARGREAADTGIEPEIAQRARAVLDFWFAPAGDPEHGRMRKAWFTKDSVFDDEIRRRFLHDHEHAAAGVYDALASRADGALALLILLDQVPRNLFRGTARAFATDAQARAIAARVVADGLDAQLKPVERLFVYLPFEHSEDLNDQRRSVALMESLPVTAEFSRADFELVVDFARRHLDVIERFGRFPHRNAALGRSSTPEELAFLEQPGSSF